MNKKELRQLSKGDLVRIILQQQELISQQAHSIEKLERLMRVFDNPHTPSSKQQKKNTEKESNKPRFPGKPSGSNGGGIKIPQPDEIVEHTLEACPFTGLPLGKPVGYRKKVVIDFPDKPIRVVEHRIMQYISPANGQVVEPEITLPESIYGKNLQSIVVMLKNLTNSHDKIASFMQELGAPSFSSASVQSITDAFASKLEPVRESLLDELRNSQYVHSDETGLRKDGQNGFVWGIFTTTIAIFSAAMSRARENITSLLYGFKGIIVTDGYNAYDQFPLRQRCWAHLLREFKEYAENNEEIGIQYKRLKRLYEKLKLLKEKILDETEIAKVKWELNDIVTCLKVIKGSYGLTTLIENGKDDWFTALYYPGVPLENNQAERELRSVVLLRKMIGCYRNEKGKRWIDIVLSVLHTWKLQGKNMFQELCALAC